MAIVPAVPGLEVCIQSGAVATDLKEHPDDGVWTYPKFSHLPNTKRSSVYIESKAGATFRIRLVLKHPFMLTSQSLTFKASVDGHGIAQASCSSDYFTRSSFFYMDLITARLDRISPTQITSRALKFDSIRKVDDVDARRVKDDVKTVQRLGEIVVSVFRTLQRDPLPIPGQTFRPSTHVPTEEVAEKALKGKAISHGVTYGQQEVVTRHIKETIDVDGPYQPIAVFVFKYRSREDLQAELIIPRSVSPEPASGSRSGPHDRRVRLANLKREIEEIKAEDGIEEVAGSQKRSRSDSLEIISRKTYKTSLTATGKTMIDLTDD